jgi:hypothetical protein
MCGSKLSKQWIRLVAPRGGEAVRRLGGERSALLQYWRASGAMKAKPF